MPEITNTKNLTESELKTAFSELESQVTKFHKYQACIDLGRGGVPVDIRTIEDYLKGDVRSEDFANKLLQYLTEKGYTVNTAA